MKRFEPYQTPSRVAELVEKARKFNQDLDAVDRAAGGRVQADCRLTTSSARSSRPWCPASTAGIGTASRKGWRCCKTLSCW